MTSGIATLSIDPPAGLGRRGCRWVGSSPGSLREYIVGPENQLLVLGLTGHRLPSADQPLTLNIHQTPLTVYAPHGFGKTQLFLAVAAQWHRLHPDDIVLLVSGTDFARAYADAVKLDEVSRFQTRYQRAELLLVDDLEDLTTKPAAQHMLATVVEHRSLHARPTLFSSLVPLRSTRLDQRLVSRLAEGLSVPLELPLGETRDEILKRICDARKLRLTSSAREILRNQRPMTVPELLGILNQTCFRLDQFGRSGPMQIDAEDLGPNLLSSRQSVAPEPKSIIRASAKHYGLKTSNLTGPSRRKMDTLARSVAMYLIRNLTGASFQQIGEYFGQRDHSTVMHACRKIAAARKSDASTRNSLFELYERLNNMQEETTRLGGKPVAKSSISRRAKVSDSATHRSSPRRST